MNRKTKNNNQGYYAVPNKPLSLSFASHPGKLTREDLISNLKTAIAKSNEYGEDWIADIKADWYQRPGMIMPTEDESLLEDEKVISSQIEDMLDPWESHDKTEILLREAGVGEELQPMNEEQMEEFMSDESNRWTLRTFIIEILPYESPYF